MVVLLGLIVPAALALPDQSEHQRRPIVPVMHARRNRPDEHYLLDSGFGEPP